MYIFSYVLKVLELRALYIVRPCVRASMRPCVRACVSTSVPYFCAQAAYFGYGTFTTLQPFA